MGGKPRLGSFLVIESIFVRPDAIRQFPLAFTVKYRLQLRFALAKSRRYISLLYDMR
jgi:hypothetical protein